MIREISFTEIKPFWKKLWPGLGLEERSSRLLLGGHDVSLITNDDIKVTYFGYELFGKVVGVNSGFFTARDQYRSRGLYVNPTFRERGIAKKLLLATERQAKKEGALILWSMPREQALPTYQSVGFRVLTQFQQEIYGRNCYAMKVIK